MGNAVGKRQKALTRTGAAGLVKGTTRRRVVRAAAYDAAGTGRRSRSWNASNLGPNAILTMDADVLRRRSHDLMRQNPWAASGVESFVANCVGTGIKPQCRSTDQAFRDAVHTTWGDWVFEADAAGVMDFYGLQGLVCRSLVEGGECFVRLRERRPDDNMIVPLQLQVLEAEHVPVNWNVNLSNGNIVRAGIEFDLIGRRVAYWMYRNHPGEMLMNPLSSDLLIPVRVPAENVLHIYRPLRPGQIRGEPWMARVLIRLYELDKYDDATLVKQQIAALFTGFITTTSGDAKGLLGEGDPDAMGVALAGLEPGIMQLLEPGQNVAFSDPPKIDDPAGSFTKHQLRGSAAGMNVPYANMTGDMSEANYSSLRAGIIEFRRRCGMFISTVLVFQLCRPVWKRWITLGVLNGELPAQMALDNQREAFRSKWIGQGWQWVDPLKEVEAEIKAIRAGIKSRDASIAETGDDPEQVDQMIAAGNKRADALGLILDSDPRKVAQVGGPATAGDKQAVLGEA